MLFLDTHVVLWLYAEPSRIPAATARMIDQYQLYISPMARLEMALLHAGWSRAAEVGAHLSWTRDRFDRLITAHALAYIASHAVWIE